MASTLDRIPGRGMLHDAAYERDKIPLDSIALKRPSPERNRALVIGAGGGKDIFSASIVAAQLASIGFKVDLGGMLNPAFMHKYTNRKEPERPVNIIRENDGDVRTIERYIPYKGKNPALHDPLFDSNLPEIFNEESSPLFHFNNYYNFTGRFGTSRLVEDVIGLIAQNGYDIVAAVDIGGDILARGPKDKGILTPIMDSTSLYLMGQLPLNVKTCVIAFGLGTDGELDPQAINEILGQLEKRGKISSYYKILADDPKLAIFRNIYLLGGKSEKIGFGGTTDNFLMTLDANNTKQDINLIHKIKKNRYDEETVATFNYTLPFEHFGMFYVIDGRSLAADRRNIAFGFDNLLEQYVRLKQVSATWVTELDHGLLWSANNWTTPIPDGISLDLACPSIFSIPERMRIDMIKSDLASLSIRKFDMALVLTQDLSSVSLRRLHSKAAGMFNLLTKENAPIRTRLCAEHTAAQIRQYLLK